MDTPQQSATDPQFTALMQQLKATFEPAATPEEATLQLTTKEIYDRLQAHYPNNTYSPTTVFMSLIELGYLFHDPYRDLGYVWLLK